MQIRATVKWRQSLPLTHGYIHPLAVSLSLSLSPLPILPSSLLDPGVFQFLTPLSNLFLLYSSFSPFYPSSSRALHPLSLSLLLSSLSFRSHGSLLIFTPRPRHYQPKSRVEIRALLLVSVTRLRRLVPPGRAYIHALQFHWKIVLPLEDTSERPASRIIIATNHSPSSSILRMIET